jgi:AGCS family alanine or glycine:cation symporter
VAQFIDTLTTWLFQYVVVWMLLGAGVFFTLRLNFIQFRQLPEACRAMMAQQSTAAGGVLTPFQSFMTALGATIGTGNIAGVASAIISGGPGALFWIWVYGLVATAIKVTEATLGVKYRKTEGDTVQAGPMHYLRDGFKSPRLANAFALIAGIGALTTTPFTQPNSIAVVFESVFGVPTIVAGVVVAVLVWAVIIRGIKSIGKAAEKLSPLKVGLYLVGGLTVILFHADRLPTVFSMVVREALTTKSAMGFGWFLAMRYGIARGVYANEAGYGTAALAYGTAKSDRPSQQGLQAVMEVFIVSFVTGTISALTILVSGVAETSIAAAHAGQPYVTSTAAVAAAFNTAVPTVGGWVVAFCGFLFGYTTLIGWSFYGEQCLEYIFGRRITMPYRYAYCLLIPLGATIKPEVVWAWGDLMNVLQVFPNMVGLIGLSGVVVAYAKKGA